MKGLKRILLVFVAVSIVFQSKMFSQEGYPPNGTFEKFDRRGVFKNDAVTQSNHELISDYDGNLMLNYSTPLNLPNGLGGNFTIIYNANVDHAIFTDAGNPNDASVPLNSPEWIFGYKGFALQTLNFENFWAIDPYNKYDINEQVYNNSRQFYYLREVPHLIRGYHFTNDLLTNTLVGDVIQILKADGSKLILRNVATGGSLTGLYIEESSTNYGYANVEEINGTNGLRRMYYQPGDGLKYYFEERVVFFNDNNDSQRAKAMMLVQIINREGNSLSFDYKPTCYLKAPNHSHNHDNEQYPYGRDYFESITYTYGNNSVNELTIDYGNNIDGSSLNINSTLTQISIKNHNISREPNEDTYILNLFGKYGEMEKKGVFGSRRGAPITFDDNKLIFASGEIAHQGKRLFISSITDNLGRVDEIEYFDVPNELYHSYNDLGQIKYTDNFTESITRRYGIDHDSYFVENAYIPKRIIYHNKKVTDFEFYRQKFEYETTEGLYNISYTFNSPAGLGGSDHWDNVRYGYRNCFTNYMIKTRKMYSSLPGTETQPDIVEKYDYTWTSDPLQTNILTYYWQPKIENIYTSKKVGSFDLLDYDPDYDDLTQFTEYLYKYTKFNTGYYYSETGDAHSTIKLTGEKINDNFPNKYVDKTYDYIRTNDLIDHDLNDNLISPHNQYYDSPFFEESIITVKSDGTNSTSTTVNYNYEIHEYHPDGLANNRNSKKELKTTETLTDPNGLKTHKIYKHFGVDDNPDNSFTKDLFYKLNLLSEEKIYLGDFVNPTKTKSHIVYEYQNNESYFGKLKSEIIKTDYDHPLRRIIKNYSYYNEIDNSNPQNGIHCEKGYKGLLQSVFDDDRIKTRYEYLLGGSSAQGKLFFKDGTVNENEQITITPITPRIQLQPFKTIISVDNIDLFNKTTVYNPLGNLMWEIESNNYISSFVYDKSGRLTTARFPGCFEPGMNYNNGYSTIFNYADDLNIITGTSLMEPGKNYEFREYFNGFGLAIKKEVKNENSEWVTKVENTYDYRNLLSKEKIYYDLESFRIKKYGYDFLERLQSVNFIILSDVPEDGPILPPPLDVPASEPGLYEVSVGLQSYYYKIENGTFSRNNITVEYFETTEFIDENQKIKKTYYDKIGNVVAEKLGSLEPTLFKLNSIYQVEKVVTPEGFITNYQYDDLGYLSMKSTPDDNYTFYRYNKYGELRYEFHRENDADNTSGYVISYRYDKLGRLLSTALRNVAITGSDFLSNASFNPDVENNEDRLDNNLTLINIYDDVNEKSNYTQLNSVIPQIPEGYDQNSANTKGRLALTAYRDKPDLRWNYKIFRYDPLGRTDKVFIKEQSNQLLSTSN